MNLPKDIKYWFIHWKHNNRHPFFRLLIFSIVLSATFFSCEMDQHDRSWFDEEQLSISQYIDNHKEEYSKFYRLMEKGKLLNTLYGYNPHGDDYTLFLPTDEAIDRFIEQNDAYENFEELLRDTSTVNNLVRYHTLNQKYHTNEFPYGAFTNRTLTGERLIVRFASDGNEQIISINNTARIIKQNIGTTNGYINEISEVIKPAEISGYNWLQQQEEYSLLAKAMKLAGLGERLTWNNYTILAENDSVYHKIGINTIEDLIDRFSTPGVPYNDRNSSFYKFAAYHILSNEYYLNDFYWGNHDYWTFLQRNIPIEVGIDLFINLGVDIYGKKVTPTGDTLNIKYISPIWEGCNIMTSTGPVHSISNVLYFKALP